MIYFCYASTSRWYGSYYFGFSGLCGQIESQKSVSTSQTIATLAFYRVVMVVICAIAIQLLHLLDSIHITTRHIFIGFLLMS